jgi:hypothetical protein
MFTSHLSPKPTLPTAWEHRRAIKWPYNCLEFGVGHGYSTAALSCYSDSLPGVDIFAGDKHTADFSDCYADTTSRRFPFDNIHLIRGDYRHWIARTKASMTRSISILSTPMSIRLHGDSGAPSIRSVCCPTTRRASLLGSGQ